MWTYHPAKNNSSSFIKNGEKTVLPDADGFSYQEGISIVGFMNGHAASLADAQAEIARLRGALEALESIGVLENGLIGSGPEIEHAQSLARKALKK